MRIYVATKSALSFGWNQTSSTVGMYFESRLDDYGDVISEVEVMVCFRGGRIPDPSLEPTYEQYHREFLAGVPSVQFARKRKRMLIRYQTKLVDATHLERRSFLSADLFAKAAVLGPGRNVLRRRE
jgi:hypothetical protein